MRVELYTPQHKQAWDEFVAGSRNGTFLFHRDYMEYHRDRFCDSSLLVFDDRGRLAALLPANRDGGSVVSHGGLTYGGLVIGPRLGLGGTLDVFAAALAFLHGHSVSRLVYKAVPHIYHLYPAEDESYALFLAGARLTRCDPSAVVAQDSRPGFQERRRRGAKKALGHGLIVSHATDFGPFWRVLTDNLRARNLRPVHTLEEIELLHSRFPDHIRLYLCSEQGSVVAGTVIYETQRVAHAQYIAASGRGKEIGGLDLLFQTLLSEVYVRKPFFDFGVSTEKEGRFLNRGLMEQKEGFGAGVIAYEQYEIALQHFDGACLLASGQGR